MQEQNFLKKGMNNLPNENEQSESSMIKAKCVYNGYSVKRNLDVELKLRFTEDNLANAIQFIAGIGKELIIKAKVNESKDVIKLGKFNVNSIKVDRNANAYISFMSNSGAVNIDEISQLLVDEAEIMIVAKIVVSQ